jgi:hypothetical protein
MKSQVYRALYRSAQRAELSSGRSAFDRESHRHGRRLVERRKAGGQAMVIVALLIMLLVLMVGLAVDGGSMMNQRREAQNAVDGAALAGTRTMLPYYQQMIFNNPNGDVDWRWDPYELNIRVAIDTYAAMNGVITTTIEAYFVNDNKQIVTVNSGLVKNGERCGVAQPRGPCQVGENDRVPWTLGAKGIMVKGRAQTASYFMGIFGYNDVGASATATAFMGVGASIDNIGLLPMGLYTTSLNINNVRPGDHHVLIEADENQGSGNWGWVDYNGQGSSRVIGKNWLICGYNPSVRNEAQWRVHCPDETSTWNESRNYGPTQHWQPMHDPLRPTSYDPVADPTFVYSLIYGEQWHGWWVYGSSGAVNANCQDLESKVDRSPNGYAVLFPIFDRVVDASPGSYFHVRIVIAFMLYPGYVSCRPSNPPTSTPCAGPCPTATPGSGGGGGRVTHWHIEGDVLRIYSSASNGRHGDLRQTTVAVVFLDN